MGYLQNYIKKDKVVEKHITDLDVDKIMQFITDSKVPESPEYFTVVNAIILFL